MIEMTNLVPSGFAELQPRYGILVVILPLW